MILLLTFIMCSTFHILAESYILQVQKDPVVGLGQVVDVQVSENYVGPA